MRDDEAGNDIMYVGQLLVFFFRGHKFNDILDPAIKIRTYSGKDIHRNIFVF